MNSRFEKIACSTMSSNLVEEKLYQLEQVLRKRLPESVELLNICIIARQQRFPNSATFQFYAYVDSNDEDWQKAAEEHSFIVCIEELNLTAANGIILLPPKVVTCEMAKAFDSLVDWSIPQVFQTIPQPFWSTLQKLLKAHKNLNPENNDGTPGIVLALTDLERAKNLELCHDSTILLRQLGQEDVAEIVSNWRWGMDHSEKAIRETIKTLVSCGAFNEDGEMVSSALQSVSGLFNILYTPDKFRRRGYGKLVMRALSIKSAQEVGTYPAGECEVWNIASKSLMESLGYEEVFRSSWFYYCPSNPTA